MTRPLSERPSRLYDKFNPNWQNYYKKRNAFFVQSVQMHVNHLLKVRGYVFLNDIYDLLGFERTIEAGMVGWIWGSEHGDSYIDFGVWGKGFDRAKAWIRGEIDVMELHFNVDRTTESMPRRIKRLQDEGKLG